MGNKIRIPKKTVPSKGFFKIVSEVSVYSIENSEKCQFFKLSTYKYFSNLKIQ